MRDLANILNRDRDKNTLLKGAARMEIKKIKNIIIRKNKLKANSCEYQLPQFIRDFPLIDMKSCHRYIVKGLKKNGLKVKMLDNDRVYISWESLLE